LGIDHGGTKKQQAQVEFRFHWLPLCHVTSREGRRHRKKYEKSCDSLQKVFKSRTNFQSFRSVFRRRQKFGEKTFPEKSSEKVERRRKVESRRYSIFVFGASFAGPADPRHGQQHLRRPNWPLRPEPTFVGRQAAKLSKTAHQCDHIGQNFTVRTRFFSLGLNILLHKNWPKFALISYRFNQFLSTNSQNLINNFFG
jgi:hypothetical protein